jgi:hypothetical protein
MSNIVRSRTWSPGHRAGGMAQRFPPNRERTVIAPEDLAGAAEQRQAIEDDMARRAGKPTGPDDLPPTSGGDPGLGRFGL